MTGSHRLLSTTMTMTLLLAATAACDSQQAGTKEQSATAKAEAPQAEAALADEKAAAKATGTKGTSAKGADTTDDKAADEKANGAAAAGAAGCPEGTWKYDYADQAADVLFKNVPGAKLVKKEGDFTCEFDGGKAGKVRCLTVDDKPVVNVVEVTTAGMKIVTTVTISGEVVTNFKITAENKIEFSADDLSKLKFSIASSMNGNALPVPTQKLESFFGGANGEVTHAAFKCDGPDALAFKYDLDSKNMSTDWQNLTRVK